MTAVGSLRQKEACEGNMSRGGLSLSQGGICQWGEGGGELLNRNTWESCLYMVSYRPVAHPIYVLEL